MRQQSPTSRLTAVCAGAGSGVPGADASASAAASIRHASHADASCHSAARSALQKADGKGKLH